MIAEIITTVATDPVGAGQPKTPDLLSQKPGLIERQDGRVVLLHTGITHYQPGPGRVTRQMVCCFRPCIRFVW